jgi:hypothetical protein
MNKLAMLALVGVAVLLPAVAATPADASVTPRAVNCTKTVSSDYHTASAHCTGSLSPYTQFRVFATFCTTSNCNETDGPWVNFGGTSTVHSGGYTTQSDSGWDFR